ANLIERHRRRNSRTAADHARGVALAREVLGQRDVAFTEAMDAAVAEADLDLALEGDHVLSARRVVPVAEMARGCDAEGDARGRTRVGELGMVLDGDPLDVRLIVWAGVEARDLHVFERTQYL